MRKCQIRLAGLLLAALGFSPLQAQEYSYDGNRWYEVEVTIFSTAYNPSGNDELAVPDKITPAYLPRLRELLAPGSSFDVDFPEEIAAASQPADGPPANLPAFPGNPVPPASGLELPPGESAGPALGPLYSPAVKDSFRILDFSRDAYVDLSGQAAQFAPLNRNLERSGEHRVLWTRTWRQPMQGRGQAQAVFVSGGEVRGAHSELEGSLRLSDSNGAVQLDINVWLSRFGIARILPQTGFNTAELPQGQDWQIPERPFPLQDEAGTNAAALEAARNGPVFPGPTPVDPMLVEVWQLEQSRTLDPNQLYYLDNPALGVLIQARPYLLPERQTAADEQDF